MSGEARRSERRLGELPVYSPGCEKIARAGRDKEQCPGAADRARHIELSLEFARNQPGKGGRLRSISARHSPSNPVSTSLCGFAGVDPVHHIYLGAIADLRAARALLQAQVASHWHHAVAGTRFSDGGEVSLWFRITNGFRKENGKWKIVHAHSSVPFYMDGSSKACLDLKP